MCGVAGLKPTVELVSHPRVYAYIYIRILQDMTHLHLYYTSVVPIFNTLDSVGLIHANICHIVSVLQAIVTPLVTVILPNSATLIDFRK